MRQVIIYPGEDGYFVVECPSLPGCVSQGVTKEEAVANIKEAIRGYIAALEEGHLPVPEDVLMRCWSRFSRYFLASFNASSISLSLPAIKSPIVCSTR